MSEIYPIFVIGRCFGAGGRAVGKLVAERLSIPYYDNELLKEAARQSGYSSHIFAHADEKRPSFFKRLLTQSYGVQESYNSDALSNETLYQAQSKVIRKIAEQGPCVIVGRTADYILRDFPGLTSVFLHAPLEFRAQKIVDRGDAQTLEEASETARRRDKEREGYYNYFTGRHWGAAANYNISLDSSQLTPSQLVDIVISFSKSLLGASEESREKDQRKKI